MKISDYLNRLYDKDPEFKKWLNDYWLSWIPPKRKVKVFADSSLPREFIDEINNYEAFKLVGKAERESDLEVYKQAKKLKALLLTRDNDFWNDKKFPLWQSSGIIIIEGSTIKDINYAFGYFLAFFGIIDGIRKDQDYPCRMKFKISRKGLVLKLLRWDSKVEITNLEY